ncbi:unnamed protein product, partial [Effrenium voratum]
MHCYRHTEGFTLDELQTLTAIYSDVVDQVARRREGMNLLPAEMLGDVLVQFFGPAQAQKARFMQQECIARMAKREDHSEVKKPSIGMGFHEVLLWARRLREKEFENYRDAFRKYDEDGSNSIDMSELQKVIKELGYTMTKATILEIKQAAFARTDLEDICSKTSSEVLDSDSMDYDSFVHFMMMLQQSDGFSQQEMQEIKATFKKFDEDTSGDIDVCELAEMLRFQGHAASIDEVRRLHARVDFNGSGALDLAEFVRFMRLHREELLESVREAYDALKDSSTDRLGPERLLLAINKLEFAREDRRIDVEPYMPTVPQDFDGFVTICDRVREAQVAVDRKRAGFSDKEIEHYWALFTSYDMKKTGVLSMEECTNLLSNLSFHVRTVEEQQELKQMLHQAKTLAEKAGADVCQESGSVSFYVLLQLLQALFVNHEREQEAQLVQVADEAGFTMSEVTEFNDIFNQYWLNELEPGEADDPTNRLRKKTVSRSSVYKLLRAMGIRLDHHSKEQVDRQVHHYSGDRCSFNGFLKLMRWMVEVNFASINSGVCPWDAGGSLWGELQVPGQDASEFGKISRDSITVELQRGQSSFYELAELAGEEVAMLFAANGRRCEKPKPTRKVVCTPFAPQADLSGLSNQIGEKFCDHPEAKEARALFCRYPPRFYGHAGICKMHAQFCPFEELQDERDAEVIETAVVNIDSDTFYSMEECGVFQKELWIFKVFVHWCPHCQQLMPQLYRLALLLRRAKTRLRFGAVNCASEEKLCAEQRWPGHPLLVARYLGSDLVVHQAVEHWVEAVKDAQLRQMLPRYALPGEFPVLKLLLEQLPESFAPPEIWSPLFETETSQSGACPNLTALHPEHPEDLEAAGNGWHDVERNFTARRRWGDALLMLRHIFQEWIVPLGDDGNVEAFSYEQLRVVEAWVALLVNNLPAAFGIHEALHSLRRQLSSRLRAAQTLQGAWLCADEWKAMRSELLTSIVEVGQRSFVEEPSTCATETCRLWALLHVLASEGLRSARPEAPEPLLRGIHGFLEQFFKCHYCRRHFLVTFQQGAYGRDLAFQSPQ